MIPVGKDSLNTRRDLDVNGKTYAYYSLPEAVKQIGDISRLPFSLKVLLENLLRFQDDSSVSVEDIKAVAKWLEKKSSSQEIAYRPARVLLQDFTGVPAVVDLAAMREGVIKLGGKPEQINPLTPVDLVIDHSVMVDAFGNGMAFQLNVEKEFERNLERYQFLKWGQQAFDNFRVVPPGTGICHQVNLEYLGKTIWTDTDQQGATVAYPDTLVGTDSHTTMINGLAVLGWGVGGIEAEAAMLGQPISMLIPEVVGFKLEGKLPEGATATDLVLTVTQMLRERGVVGKFVEFYGDGLSHLTLADRATIANMAPEYGATCGFFPVDSETINYLTFTGRDADTVALVEAYAKAQGMWREDGIADPEFTDSLHLDLSTVAPSIAGPKRPQDRVLVKDAKASFINVLAESAWAEPSGDAGEMMNEAGMMNAEEAELSQLQRRVPVAGKDHDLGNGDVVIAAITSCTNTSNPSVMLAAGLVARNARKKGLTVKPWVKTSLAPGSQVVTDYLNKAGLQDDLDALGFNLVGYGCTTCIGNSGPLPEEIANAIESADLNVCGVLSGNRNFEGRINPHVQSNYLASPPLVVAYAIAGNMTVDIMTESLGKDENGNDVYLKDIWPSSQEIQEMIGSALTPAMFTERYADVFAGTKEWQEIDTVAGQMYSWDDASTYVRNPPFFEDTGGQTADIQGAHALAILGDSVTTDHISPAGAIKQTAPAGEYLKSHDVAPLFFNSYGSRRGNHEVMMRGTFANIRIRNEMIPNTEGGVTKYVPTGEEMPIYDAAMKYIADGRPLIVVGGKEYGTGSSRDWAAKGTRLLGVKVVIAESFERIHRSNLVGMGVLPAEFVDETRQSLKLTGEETFDVRGIEGLSPRKELELVVTYPDGSQKTAKLRARIDTADELGYFDAGGILHYVMRRLAA